MAARTEAASEAEATEAAAVESSSERRVESALNTRAPTPQTAGVCAERHSDSAATHFPRSRARLHLAARKLQSGDRVGIMRCCAQPLPS